MTDPAPEKVDLLIGHIDRTLGCELHGWPGGWPRDIEAALFDAVFSIRAAYGTPTTGVRAVVGRWLEHRGGHADDLATLAASDPNEVRKIVRNDAKANGRRKADIVVEAARRLSDARLRHASDFVRAPESQRAEMKSAYLSVKGCGPVTWYYFGMLLGQPDSKADTWIMRFVRTALSDPHVTTERARELITRAAASRGVNASQLDHSIWGYARTHQQ